MSFLLKSYLVENILHLKVFWFVVNTFFILFKILFEGIRFNIQILKIHLERFFLFHLLCFRASYYSKFKALIFSANIIYEISKIMQFLSFHFDIICRALHFFMLTRFRLFSAMSSDANTLRFYLEFHWNSSKFRAS